MRTTYVAELDLGVRHYARACAVGRLWVTRRFGPDPGDEAGEPSAGAWQTGNGDTVTWRRRRGPSGKILEIRVDAPGADPSVDWVHRVWIWSRPDGTCGVQVRSDAAATRASVTGPFSYEVSDPGLVRELVAQLAVVDAGRPVTASPCDADGDPGFVGYLRDRRRRLPVVVVDEVPGGFAADALARELVGVATVARSAAGTEVGPVVPGGARIIWAPDGRPEPGVSTVSLQRARHTGRPEWMVARQILAAAAFRIPIPAIAGEVEADQRARRRDELQQLRMAVTEDRPVAPDELWDALDEQLSENDRLSAELAEVRRELDDARCAIRDHRATIAWWGAHHRVGSAAEATEPSTAGNLRQVLEAAERLDHVIVTADAFADAKITFSRPVAVLEDLRELDAICSEWRAGTLATSPQQAAKQRGLPYRMNISDTAARQYAHAYRSTVDGETVELGPHLAYGGPGGAGHAVLRVYLALDDRRHSVIVGRLMRHGPDGTNR